MQSLTEPGELGGLWGGEGGGSRANGEDSKRSGGAASHDRIISSELQTSLTLLGKQFELIAQLLTQR